MNLKWTSRIQRDKCQERIHITNTRTFRSKLKFYGFFFSTYAIVFTHTKISWTHGTHTPTLSTPTLFSRLSLLHSFLLLLLLQLQQFLPVLLKTYFLLDTWRLLLANWFDRTVFLSASCFSSCVTRFFRTSVTKWFLVVWQSISHLTLSVKGSLNDFQFLPIAALWLFQKYFQTFVRSSRYYCYCFLFSSEFPTTVSFMITVSFFELDSD